MIRPHTPTPEASPFTPEASLASGGAARSRGRAFLRRLPCAVLLLAVALLAAASGASAQPGWGGGLFVTADVFEADRGTWHEERLAVQRRFARGAASLEGGTASRNGFTDPFVAADLYANVGESAYGNVRAQWAPEASGVPRLDLLGEGYVAFGNGWEGSLGARHVISEANTATLGTGSLAMYVGNWTVRARGVAAVKEPLAVSTTLSARYLFDGIGGLTAPFAEVRLGRGQEPVVAAGEVDVRRSWVVSGRLQREVRAGFGVSASLGYVWDDTLTRWIGGLGVTGRF